MLTVYTFKFSLYFSEPNAYAPEILSVYKNSRDIPLFRGKVREHETVVHLEPGLLARDNDTVGASRKSEIDFFFMRNFLSLAYVKKRPQFSMIQHSSHMLSNL
jgi:hypothetical protein